MTIIEKTNRNEIIYRRRAFDCWSYAKLAHRYRLTQKSIKRILYAVGWSKDYRKFHIKVSEYCK